MEISFISKTILFTLFLDGLIITVWGQLNSSKADMYMKMSYYDLNIKPETDTWWQH